MPQYFETEKQKFSSLKATVFDGSFHEVDSSEMAFKMAGILSVREAAKACNPVVLEPMMKVEVTTPEEYMGDVIGDISSRRGQVQGSEEKYGDTVITANVPLANMFGYVTNLRSLTQGRANYAMELSHYDEVPSNVAEELRAKAS